MATALPEAEVLAPAAPVLRRRPRIAGLGGVVTTVWATSIPPDARMLRVVPDAAVDLVLSGGRLVVAGPDTRAVRERLASGWVLGVQLVPGAVAPILGAPASACVNGRTDIAELWGPAGRELQDRLAGTTDRVAAGALIERAIAARLHGLRRFEIDPVPGALRRTFARGRRLDARSLGLGERQLRRRCVAAFGYPTATLRRIVRFQAFLDALESDATTELAVLAHRLGYSDQSHLTHQTREFSGLTPQALRRLAVHPLAGTITD
jgi:AraC-like DNA-binding protein